MLQVLMGVVVCTLIITGCGGGGNAGTTGIVTGYVKDAASGLGISGLTVTIDGRSGRTSADGAFTVRGIPPGDYQLQVVPTELFVMVPGDPIIVTVVAGTTTVLPAPVLVIDPDNLPPNPGP